MLAILSCLCRQYEESGGDLAALRAESELAFAPHSRSTYSLADDVVLELHTKNIGTEVGAVWMAYVHRQHLWVSAAQWAILRLSF
jgi:hypothetical protein